MAAKIRACYPGSFHPLTIAHLAIVDAAREQCQLDSVVLTLSERTLGKDPESQDSAGERAAALMRFQRERPWLDVLVTSAQLLVDVSAGFDWLILGADKWAQIQELQWYGAVEERDSALARLPRLAIVARPPVALGTLPLSAKLLELPDPTLSVVSSTAVRSGMEQWRA